jgi:D-inositol-3-phosphate glycosyltransferase
MNVYVRELSEVLAGNGIEVDVYAVARDGVQDVVDLDSGVRVHHISAGSELPVNQLHLVADRMVDEIATRIELNGGVDVLHSHYWLSGMVGHKLKHELGVPLVSNFHTLGHVKAKAGLGETSSVRTDAELAAIGCSDVVVASNLVEANELRSLYNADASIDVIAPGMDPRLFSPGNKELARAVVGLPSTRPIILFVGRIQQAKGLDRAVEALAQVTVTHPDALLVAIGGPSGSDGEQSMARTQQRVHELGLGANVAFVGPQPQDKLRDYFRAADICVVPSRIESFGFVALEAAACGTPVVASAVGGLQTVVEHGRTGFLVSDVDEMAGATDHLLSHRSKATAFGNAAAVKAATYTWAATGRRVLRIYDRLISDESIGVRNAECLSA